MCAATVGTWRRRFAERRMEGLYDEPRPDAPREIGDDEIAATIRKTPETVSEGGTHWSWRAMGSTETGHAPRRCSGTGALSACNRIGWRRSSCRPIRCWWRKCAISSGVAAGTRRCAMRRREIAGTGARPRAAACADASRSGRPHDYTRHGTASLFAALDVKAGTIAGKCMPRHRASEFRKCPDEVERSVPEGLDVHIVMDNVATHKTKPIRDWLAKRSRWHVHFTPNTNWRLVDQSGRALLRRAHRTSLAARRLPVRGRTRKGNQGVHRTHQRRSQTFPMSKDCRSRKCRLRAYPRSVCCRRTACGRRSASNCPT